MKASIGWLTFLLSVGFAGGMVSSLIGNVWFKVADANSVIGFFGFGIPMIVAGLGTAALWSEKKPLQKTLAVVSTFIGLTCGLCLFILVAGWVFADNSAEQPQPSTSRATVQQSRPSAVHFFGFGVPMLVCGGFGIAMFFQSESKGETS